jgi:hypothetical protein
MVRSHLQQAAVNVAALVTPGVPGRACGVSDVWRVHTDGEVKPAVKHAAVKIMAFATHNM